MGVDPPNISRDSWTSVFFPSLFSSAWFSTKLISIFWFHQTYSSDLFPVGRRGRWSNELGLGVSVATWFCMQPFWRTRTLIYFLLASPLGTE